ncbi:transglycosylase SLT domain-containing protein [Kitasatospora sp. KL5]|uniref:transglycosylase SLT domain-containing protein n=1 Tax=Kitasatospora sp. KL5 TaxID=3425125 RepID=UPI003D6F2E7B
MPKHARPRRLPAVLLSGRWITTAALATAAVAVTTANAAPGHPDGSAQATSAGSRTPQLEPTAWSTPPPARHTAATSRTTGAIPAQRTGSPTQRTAVPVQRSTGTRHTADPSPHAVRPTAAPTRAARQRTADRAGTAGPGTTARSTTTPTQAAPSTAPIASTASNATARTGAPGSAQPTTPSTAATSPQPAAAPTAQAAGDLDGWIKEALAVMAEHHIPGTYDGIHRNIMRESSGNPRAINLTDSNAAAGHPSKGLLQVIDPTFQAYHVPGTSTDIYDPVANITAACNYAAHFYGSIDNVNGPY